MHVENNDDPARENITINLSRAELLMSDKRTGAARAFLDSAEDSIALRPLVTHYFAVANGMQSGLVAAVRNEHGYADWEPLAQRHDELQNLVMALMLQDIHKVASTPDREDRPATRTT